MTDFEKVSNCVCVCVCACVCVRVCVRACARMYSLDLCLAALLDEAYPLV